MNSLTQELKANSFTKNSLTQLIHSKPQPRTYSKPYELTQELMNSPNNPLKNSRTCTPTKSLTEELTQELENSLSEELKNSQVNSFTQKLTQELIHSKAHPRTYSMA